MKYRVIEKFISIDGEGPLAGELAVFIRFEGCNLRCSWCDTCYSFDGTSTIEEMSPQEIYEYIKQTGIHHVTLTGGEPLIQPHIHKLLDLLAADENILTHIETNGAVDISPFLENYKTDRIRYIVDFKLPESGMMKAMKHDNLKAVRPVDVYKFVIGSSLDLEQAYKIILENKLNEKIKVYLSPVLGTMEPAEIVEYMKQRPLEGIRLQLQLHKFIWDKTARGV